MSYPKFDPTVDYTKSAIKYQVVNRVKYTFGKFLPKDTPLSVDFRESMDADIYGFACEVQMHLFGVDKRHKSTTNQTIPAGKHFYPKTWWDHFKMTYFPEWLKKYFPIQLETVDTVIHDIHHHYETRICPHLSSSNDEMHLNWIVSTGDEGGPPKPSKFKTCPRCFDKMILEEHGTHRIYICTKCGKFEEIR